MLAYNAAVARPRSTFMYWLVGSLVGIAIGMAWVHVELATAKRKPLI